PRAEPDMIGGAGELEATLREVVERLAPLERTPCSPGEREAAEWLAERFRRIPGVEVALEDEPSWGIFPPTSTALGLLGMAGAELPTLVLLAHHDAPQTGVVFDQSLQKRIYELAPQLIERFKTSPPQWWLGLAGPLCTLVAAAARRAGFARAALATGALGTALVADIWRNATVPGANDNLSGVAALVALAEKLRQRPVEGVRVLLVSCGAEETLQDGV